MIDTEKKFAYLIMGYDYYTDYPWESGVALTRSHAEAVCRDFNYGAYQDKIVCEWNGDSADGQSYYIATVTLFEEGQ